MTYFEKNQDQILHSMVGYHHLNAYMGLLGRLLPQDPEDDGEGDDAP